MDAKDALVGFARLPGAQIVIGNSHQPVLIKQGMTFADSDNQQTDAAPQAGKSTLCKLFCTKICAILPAMFCSE